MKTFKTIFLKEFTDTIRDRRTLFMMIVFPLVLIPLLIMGITRLQMSQMRKAQEKVLRIGLTLNGNAPAIIDMIRAHQGMRVTEQIPADSIRALLERDSLDAVIVFASDFDTTVQALRAGTVQLFYKSSDDYDIAKRRLQALMSEYERSLLKARFARLKLDEQIVEAIRVEEHDIASFKEKFGKAVGGFIPYMFVIFCFLGSMYPAIDLAAGEKERGTIETLLTAPVSRFQILIGKFCVVVLTGLLSAAVSVIGLFLAVRQTSEIPQDMMQAILGILDAQSVIIILSLLLPLTVFFAAFLLSLSIFAKSYKEAQSLISPLTIVIILPVLVGMIPGFSLTPVTALIPILNVSLATKDVIAGTVHPLYLAEVYASLIVLAALSLYGCSRWFEREETIFRGA
jgi:sodium transport system permease protein